MSLLDDMLLEMAVPAHQEMMGDTVIYTPANERPRDIVAVISRKNMKITDGTSHTSVQTILFVTTSYDRQGINSPSLLDRIRIAGEDWGFFAVQQISGGTITAQFLKVDITQYGKKPSQL